MSTMPDEVQKLVREGFKYLNRFMLINWRLGMGPYLSLWPHTVGQFIVLVHKGRKTGLTRRTPVNFAEIDGDIYITAGFGKIAHWYKNIMAQPQIEIWTPDGWWQAEAEDITEAENNLELMREVIKGSGFAAYIAGINPHTMSDIKLAQATETYRLLRIHRTQPCTGTGGPGDLIWVWPLLVMALLPLKILRIKVRTITI